MSGNKYNEQEIIEQLKDPTLRGNAFSLVVKQHSQEIYWHIRRMVLVHDDANDLVQETFVKAWSNIGNFQGKSKISTWLYRIAINETLTFLNKRITFHSTALKAQLPTHLKATFTSAATEPMQFSRKQFHAFHKSKGLYSI